MTNKTIGMVTCPLCNEPAAVRKNQRGKFYYISSAGMITPNDDFGQTWFVEHAAIWGEDGMPPDDVPAWIAENKSHPPNTRSQVRTQPAAQPEAQPEPEPSSPQDDEAADAGSVDPSLDPPPADVDDDDSTYGFF